MLTKKQEKVSEGVIKIPKERKFFVQPFKNSTDIDLKKVWPKILAKIKKDRMAVYSFVIANNLITVTNDKLMIGFNKEHTFHKESLEYRCNKIFLQDLIKKETGRLLTVKCVFNNKRTN